jgi:hypothetical protein
MRVSRESLVQIAKENAQARAFNNHDIIAAYLTGSLVSTNVEPLLGGTADIDIVFVHATPPAMRREIVKLTPDFHLDIAHRTKAEFKSPRELRADPWLGFEMYNPTLLLEREKFFDFIQAGLRAGFEFGAPALTLQRCRKLLAESRKGWLDLMDINKEQAGPKEVRQYLQAVQHAANTISVLSGSPLQDRRLLLDFPTRAQAADRPNFTAELLSLVGVNQFDADILSNWLPKWKQAFLAASEKPRVDLRVHAARINYYEKAMQAMMQGNMPVAALWPMLLTWTLSAEVLVNSGQKDWQRTCTHLGLLGKAFEGKTQALDQFIDKIEIYLDELALANGVESSANR